MVGGGETGGLFLLRFDPTMQLDGTVHSHIRFAGRIPATGESAALHTARWHGEGKHAVEVQCAPWRGVVVLKWLEWE